MRYLLFLAMLRGSVRADQSPEWVVTKNAHFEVYSQAGTESAARALTWLEQLRDFFGQNGLLPGPAKTSEQPPLRVIGFRSVRDYDAVRHRPAADAYFLATEDRNYIVMPLLEQRAFATAAHEYAHSILHTSGLHLPLWLSEGLAGYFATVRVTGDGYELGGSVPELMSNLRRGTLPLAALFDFRETARPRTRQETGVFYAESWALADLLVSSRAYAPRFPLFISALNGGLDSAAALASVYGKTPENVRADLDVWMRERHSAKAVQGLASQVETPVAAPLDEIEADALIADLLLAVGDLDRARAKSLRVAQARPRDPGSLIVLGKIALLKGNQQDALRYWKKAFELDAQDPRFCYRYALLAGDLGETSQLRAGLERAVALRPDFDDARFHLALAFKSAGEYRAAVEQLHAMKPPQPNRAFAYWITLASALTDLDEREPAKDAAEEALKVARTETDVGLARSLRVLAMTDAAVQFSMDEEGRQRMVSTRMQHGSQNWNPFIEPSDNLQRGAGELKDVLCSQSGLTGFVVRTEEGPLTLEVPDPGHVLMRNGPGEFTCGRQPARTVQIEYARIDAGGKKTLVLRGMTF